MRVRAPVEAGDPEPATDAPEPVVPTKTDANPMVLEAPKSPALRNVARRRNSVTELAELASRSPTRPDAALLQRVRDRLEAGDDQSDSTGPVTTVSYGLLHYFEPLRLLLTYRLYRTFPVAAVIATVASRRRMITTYRVYNFRSLRARQPSRRSSITAVQVLAAEPAHAHAHQHLAPDAAAAMVTYTFVHTWECARRSHRGSISSPQTPGAAQSLMSPSKATPGMTSPTKPHPADHTPFVSDHTLRRLGPELAAVMRTPKAGPATPTKAAGSPDGSRTSVPFLLSPTSATAATTMPVKPPASGGSVPSAAHTTAAAASVLAAALTPQDPVAPVSRSLVGGSRAPPVPASKPPPSILAATTSSGHKDDGRNSSEGGCAACLAATDDDDNQEPSTVTSRLAALHPIPHTPVSSADE